MRRLLALFLTSVLLCWLVGLTNHHLSGWHVYLYLGGGFVTYAALNLPLRPGLDAVLLAGLLCDATTPGPFGLQALCFGLAHCFLFNLRNRLDRDAPAMQVVVTLLANLGIFLAVSLAHSRGLPDLGATWGRLLWDLLWSQVALIVITPWFFALQRRALELADPVTTAWERRHHD
ncbi:MAG: rod shape-determining protein MreD [Opitutae bacterium]|nr:rod shape-determining protein MreD [Opitutae bacterium]